MQKPVTFDNCLNRRIGEHMKKTISSIVFLCMLVLFSCSVQHSVDSEFSDETGTLQMSLRMEKVGALD
jgi:hypothetical protein